MKNILLFFLIALLMDGVFGESVSVMEGDSVTLHTGLSEIQENDVIQWRFKTDLIAQFNTVNKKISLYDDVLNGKFKDRLKLDSQTGDLTIRNIRTEHTRDYEVSNLNTLKRRFSVSVVPVDDVKSVSVLEGDSVTLYTGLTDTQRDAVIQWRYGQQKSPVAEINRTAGIFNTYDGPDGRFRERLQLDHQTGSLTIKNIGTSHSGVYEVEIISTSSRYTIHHTQSFIVTVSDAVKSLSVKEGYSVTLQTNVTEIQKDDLILWMFGDTVLAEINKATNQRFYTYDGPDGRLRNRLKLDHQTGSLIITDTRTTDSGLYEVKISSNRHTIKRRFIVFVSVTDAVKSVSVKEGGTVTLLITEIQNDDLILWMFGDTVLAEINKADLPFYTYDGPDGRLRGRLKLDHQTGSLIITDTRTTDSGVYKLKISSSRHTINQRFIVFVSVTDAVKSLSVKEGYSVTLQTNVTEIQKDDLILWMFGDTVLAEISKAAKQLYNGPDGRFRDRLKLDHQTGSLIITDTRTTDSGLYKLKISSSRYIMNQRFSVIVTDSSLTPAYKSMIDVGVVGDVLLVSLLLAAITAIVIFCRCKISQPPKRSWKTLSVIEGETVPLHPSGTEIIKEDNIRWLFKKSPLAEIKRKSPASVNVLHENFKGRLDWPGNLGPLIIKNIQNTDSGLYELQIIRTENNIQTLELFMVVVFAKPEIKIIKVKEGGSVTLESGVTEIQKDDEILWNFGLDTPIAAIQGGRKKTPPFGSGWRSIFRLKLDENGSLTIRNIRRLDTGFYALRITRSVNASLHLFRVEISNSEVIQMLKEPSKTQQSNDYADEDSEVIQMLKEPSKTQQSNDYADEDDL